MKNQLPKRVTRKRLAKFLTCIFVILVITSIFLGILGIVMLFKKHNAISPVAQSFNDALSVKSAQTSKLAEVQNGLKRDHIDFKAVVWRGNFIYILLSDDELVIFSPQKSISSQIDSLQFTLNHFTIEGKRFKRVDFSFDRPIITF